MSDNTDPQIANAASVNPQITDSVTQANIKILGDAPAIALGNVYLATAQALSIAAHNATNAQQQVYVTMQAATTMGVTTILQVDTASAGVVGEPILQAKLDDATKLLQADKPASASVFVVESADTSDEFADHIRSTTDAFAASLKHLGEPVYIQLLQTIQLAATTATLAAMIKSPEQIQSYERILEIIKGLR